MDARNIEKEYLAIDTFAGFVSEDIDIEVTQRGKSKKHYAAFQLNKQKWFDAAMKQNKITRVRSKKTDVNQWDLRKIGPLSFCLLDVDLYRPMKKSLPELYDILEPGGIIVVDDCYPENARYDGSYQAYIEFMAEEELECQIVYNKLGVIRKSI